MGQALLVFQYSDMTGPKLEAEIKYFVHSYMNDVSWFQRFALHNSQPCLLTALTSEITEADKLLVER